KLSTGIMNHSTLLLTDIVSFSSRGCHTVEKEKSNTPSLFFYISIAEKGSVTKQVYEQIHEIQGIYLFIVKKLNKSGNWDSMSLIDENGSFRGEARFARSI